MNNPKKGYRIEIDFDKNQEKPKRREEEQKKEECMKRKSYDTRSSNEIDNL